MVDTYGSLGSIIKSSIEQIHKNTPIQLSDIESFKQFFIQDES